MPMIGRSWQATALFIKRLNLKLRKLRKLRKLKKLKTNVLQIVSISRLLTNLRMITRLEAFSNLQLNAIKALIG